MPIPCWPVLADTPATLANIDVASSPAVATRTATRLTDRTLSPSSILADPDRTRRAGRICGCPAEALGPCAPPGALSGRALDAFSSHLNVAVPGASVARIGPRGRLFLGPRPVRLIVPCRRSHDAVGGTPVI